MSEYWLGHIFGLHYSETELFEQIEKLNNAFIRSLFNFCRENGVISFKNSAIGGKNVFVNFDDAGDFYYRIAFFDTHKGFSFGFD